MTVATLISAVRQHLQDEPWEAVLTGSYTAGASTVTIGSYEDLEEGDVLDFAEDGTYEQMRVSATPSSSTVAVKVAHNNTTNANHASGAVFLKNPAYGTQEIVDSITHVVGNKLWPDVFAVAEATVTPDQTHTNLYDMGSAFEDVISVVQTAIGDIEDLVAVTAESVWVPSTISTSSKALRIVGWPRLDADATVLYKAKPTTSTMTAAMEPVISLGVAAALSRTKALQKTDRPDEDDRPGRYLRASREFERAFNMEKSSLRTMLLMEYGPPRKRFWPQKAFYSRNI